MTELVSKCVLTICFYFYVPNNILLYLLRKSETGGRVVVYSVCCKSPATCWVVHDLPLCSGSSLWQWYALDWSGLWHQLVLQPHLTWRLVPSYAVDPTWRSPTFSFTSCRPSSSIMVRRRATSMHSRHDYRFDATVSTRQHLTLWCPLSPYGYSYKASCARPG